MSRYTEKDKTYRTVLSIKMNRTNADTEAYTATTENISNSYIWDRLRFGLVSSFKAMYKAETLQQRLCPKSH